MKKLKDLIKSISDGGSSAHSYIVEGRSGKRRDDFLMRLVSCLECTDADVNNRPCGNCPACKQAAARTSPDIVYMQRSGKSGYKVEDAVSFTERLGMRPYGRYLIGVIDEAELLSEILQNKLLKTLEEPLDNVILLLSTSRSDELLSTVRSRCSLIRIEEYDGYLGTEDERSSEEMKEGVMLMLSEGRTFHKFREFAEKHIKTTEDAVEYIGLLEEDLREKMLSGAAKTDRVTDSIEAAEKTAMDIGRGMDKNKALKKLYLEFEGRSKNT